MVRDASSEAFGVKNRLLRYGRDIWYRKRPQVITPQAQSEEVENLKKRIKELEAQVRRAEIKAEFYDEMINVAEAKFKIPIRKKAGAKQ